VEDVRRFESELLTAFRAKHTDLLDQIRNSGTLPDTGKLDDALRTFLDGFAPSK